MEHTDSATQLTAATIGLPLFWPLLAGRTAEGLLQAYEKQFEFVSEDLRMHGDLRAALATPNRARLDLRTMVLRDYTDSTQAVPSSVATGCPTLIDAPFAGHSAMIADYQPDQSLVRTLMQNGIAHVCLTDWKSATADMKDLEIDQYLAELNVCIDDLGGRVNLVGLCQGGWMSAMLAARFPEKVASLVLAGAPIDTDAGNGPIRRIAQDTPLSTYEELVAAGQGLMLGRTMLLGWKNMHPYAHYVQEHIDLLEHIEDPVYVKKREAFASWYENPIDLPGRWYLQVISQIFKENRLAKGEFVALGRRLDLKAIRCPVYLLAGEADDITTSEQVFNAASLIGTPAGHVTKQLVPGGHIGLFMGARTLRDVWPGIARWISAYR